MFRFSVVECSIRYSRAWYINIGNRKKLHFHPDKPVSWSIYMYIYTYIYIYSTTSEEQNNVFFISHLYFDGVKRPSSGWMAVTSITHHYYMITNKFENLHALQIYIYIYIYIYNYTPRARLFEHLLQ